MLKSDMVTISIEIEGDNLPDDRYARKQLANVRLEVPAQVANDMLQMALLTLFDPTGIMDTSQPRKDHTRTPSGQSSQVAPSASTGTSDPEPAGAAESIHLDDAD